MPRLRVRIELNRRVSGVPLDTMVSVVEESRKFFYSLSEDVHIEPDRGHWVASDFDAESLNFTAEYDGPVTAEQVHAFGSAFAGATSLRRETVAQFTRIADLLGEDELVGFGLFHHDEETEPSEWRCLSKRDAMRFGEEIKLLTEAAGGQSPETPLPAVMNGSVAGRRLFKDRRERHALAADPSKMVRELESNLSRRIALLEGEIAQQNGKLQQISRDPSPTEERFQRLLTAIEMFWAQAPQHFPQIPAPATPTAAPPKRRSASVSGIVLGAFIAMLSGLAAPEMHDQWSRFAFVEPLKIPAPKMPAAPLLAFTLSPPKAVRQQTPSPAVKTVAARSQEPFDGPLIPLEIPDNIKPKVQSEVRVNVLVSIDQAGNVTSARVESIRGEKAHLLVNEALRAARESRFRPARDGDKTVQSRMILTFLFKPDSDQF